MLRKQARERREYLYRKGLESQERLVHDRKRRFRESVEAGKPIPTDLRKDSEELRKLVELDDDSTKVWKDSRDDEYRWAGVEDPKVVITTSRDPSSRLKQFSKEVKLVFPNSQRMNRGSHVLDELVKVCRANSVTDLIVLHEHRGEPDGMIVCHMPYGPTAFFGMSNVVLRHDIPKAEMTHMSEAYPHLIFHNFQTPLGSRFTSILKFLFPVPKDDTKRVMTFSNDSDYISFRHHTYTKSGKKVEIAEVGPRFELKPYQIKLGTVDQTESEAEWVAKPYMNTAKKRRFL